MRLFAGIYLFTIAIGFAALALVGTVPANWIGTWKLNVKESTFGMILIPDTPADFKILSQTIRIEQAANGIRISGDTAFSASGASDSSHEDNVLRLDGTLTRIGNVSFSFRQVDNYAFEIISSTGTPNANVDEVSRYVFSSDGTKLIATKIQTERTPVLAGADKNTGAVISRSKFVLVYDKLPD